MATPPELDNDRNRAVLGYLVNKSAHHGVGDALLAAVKPLGEERNDVALVESDVAGALLVIGHPFRLKLAQTHNPQMNNRMPTYIAIGSLALFVGEGLWAQSTKSDSSPKVPQVWQHLALQHEGRNVTGSPDLARKINSLGDEGWQLVDVESISESGTTTKIIFVFRRLK